MEQHWSNSKWLISSALLQWISGNYFTVSLGAISGTWAVGALRAAQNIMGITHILFQGLENVVPAGAARRLQLAGSKGLKKYLQHNAMFCTGVTLLFCLIISIFPRKLFLLIYGGQFTKYSYLLWWYVPIYFLISISLPLRSGLRALNKTRPIFVAYTVMSLFAMLSASFLVSQYGLVGAMIGTLGTQIILQGYLAFRLNKFLTIKV